MAKLHDKLDKLRDRILALEIEFKFMKKLIWCVLSGVIALLLKAFGPLLIKIPPSVTALAIGIVNNTK